MFLIGSFVNLPSSHIYGDKLRVNKCVILPFMFQCSNGTRMLDSLRLVLSSDVETFPMVHKQTPGRSNFW